MKTSTLLLILSLLAGIVLAFVGEKPALLVLALLPYSLWWFWSGESRLLAALVVSPTMSGALKISEWITPYKLLLVLGILRIATSSMLGARWQPLPWRVMVQYLLLILWAAARELASGLPPASFLWFDPLSVVVLMIVMGQLARSSDVLQWLGLIASLACLLQGAAVITEVLTRGGAARALGLAGQEALLAESIARIFPWALAVLLTTRSKAYRALVLVGALGGVYAVMGSGSRGGALGLLVGSLMMLVLTAENSGKVFQRLAILAGIVLVLLPLAPEVFVDRVLGSLDPTYRTTEVTDVTSGRVSQYAFVLEMVQSEPLVGWGASGYYDEWRYHNLGRATAVHSAPLEVATQFGIPAAMLWSLVMLSGVGAGLRVARIQPALRVFGIAAAASCLANLLMMMTAPGAFMSMVWGPVLLAHVLWLRVRQPEFLGSSQGDPALQRIGLENPA